MAEPPSPEPSAPRPSDYRQSHRAEGKGESYHATFSDIPYRRLIWDLERKTLDRVVRERLERGPLRHLDFACGTGRVLAHVADRAEVSVGVDVSPSMLSVARAGSERSEVLEADLTRSDILGERQFDLITAFRFFPNAQPRLRADAMAVLARHLARDGRLVFNNHRHASSLKFRLSRLRRCGGYNGMTDVEARELAASNGLLIESVRGLGFNPIRDEHMVLPVPLMRPVEEALSAWTMARPWAANVIYICRKRAGAGDQPGPER